MCIRKLVCVTTLALGTVSLTFGQLDYSWKYYRPGNTGVMGDYRDAPWIDPDGTPYIASYDPFFEEGGFAKFIAAENRRDNYANVDCPVIGDPELTGSARFSDIVPDAHGALWMGTPHRALGFVARPGAGDGRMNPLRSFPGDGSDRCRGGAVAPVTEYARGASALTPFCVLASGCGQHELYVSGNDPASRHAEVTRDSCGRCGSSCRRTSRCKHARQQSW